MNNKPKPGHTQGPWTVENGLENGMHGYRIGTTETVVAEIFPRPYLVSVSEANARLIASSPEMLSVLLIVSEEMKHKTLCKEALLDLVNHVIAKAQGKAAV